MEQKGEEKVHPTWPLPMAPAATGRGNAAAPHMHHLSSHRLQAGSKWHREPKASLQASCGLLLQKMQHFLHYFSSRASSKWHTTHSERKKFSFRHQKAVEKFPASHLQAHAPWTLICPHLLCGSSNPSPARQWPATGTWFFETPFWEDERGLCCSPLCAHYCHISEVT